MRATLLAILISSAAPQPNVTTFSGGGPILAGSVDGVGSAALFNAPTGVALSGDASLLFVCDRGNHKIRAIALATREVTTLAGGGASGVASGTALANGAGTAALFNAPWNLAFSPALNLLLVADSANNAVRAITKNGVKAAQNNGICAASSRAKQRYMRGLKLRKTTRSCVKWSAGVVARPQAAPQLVVTL
jgi:DNA-binding beta-propeller fold protein YncE